MNWHLFTFAFWLFRQRDNKLSFVISWHFLLFFLERFLISFSIVHEQFLEGEEPITINSFHALYSCICRKFQTEYHENTYWTNSDIFALECDRFISPNLLDDRPSQKWLTNWQALCLYKQGEPGRRLNKKLRLIHILHKPFTKQRQQVFTNCSKNAL